ncbi:MAG: CDP-diacylglycerol--glycerol-3-phosphate 3-phosphatidyltransferase [Acidobacteria bacterium]|nr:CDP-diacylglycerol--glycerol-3-phosphate 3-phosphatidyltransferase [Acidobacteriota bacterium]
MNLPNSVTLIRIFIAPLLVVVLLTRLSPDWFGIPQEFLGVAIFLVAACTDWLDGYLARRRQEVSTLGTLLDPIADKLLISAAFIALVDRQLAPAWAVVVIIGREFAVSGLRSIAAAEGLMIAASRMGKLKMFTQVIAAALLIASMTNGGPPVHPYAVPVYWEPPGFWIVMQRVLSHAALSELDYRLLLYSAGRAMLWVVVVSSIWSMYGYFRDFYRAIMERVEVRHRRRRLRHGRRESEAADTIPL